MLIVYALTDSTHSGVGFSRIGGSSSTKSLFARQAQEDRVGECARWCPGEMWNVRCHDAHRGSRAKKQSHAQSNFVTEGRRSCHRALGDPAIVGASLPTLLSEHQGLLREAVVHLTKRGEPSANIALNLISASPLQIKGANASGCSTQAAKVHMEGSPWTSQKRSRRSRLENC